MPGERVPAGSGRRARIEVDYRDPRVRQEFQRLNEAAKRDPRAARILRNAVAKLAGLAHESPTKHLSYLSSYGDLSDCDATYVTDGASPCFRIVTRDHAPERPGEPIRREVIAFGERERGKVYHVAAERLGRAPGHQLGRPAPAPDAPHPTRRRAAPVARAPRPSMNHFPVPSRTGGAAEKADGLEYG